MKHAKHFFMRRLAALMAFLMLISVVPVNTLATTESTEPETEAVSVEAPTLMADTRESEDGFWYEIIDGKATITGYSGNASNIIIPQEIDGYPVVEIGYSAFSDNSSLRSVTIPEGVTHLGDAAFMGCTVLSDVNLPNSLLYIGDSAFYECDALKSISIPQKITTIAGYAFYSSGLTSIELPDSITELGGRAFSDCTSLTSVVLPTGISEIQYSTFDNCTALTSVDIPGNIKSIGGSAFYGCTALSAVNLAEGILTIGSSAFAGCTALTSISIPASVTSIAVHCFNNCVSLNSINIASGNETYSFENGILYGDSGTSIVCCLQTTSGAVSIPSGVNTINAYAFNGCGKVTSIEIPTSVTSIGANAFNNCDGISSLKFPNSVTSIGGSVAVNCDNLTSVEWSGVSAKIPWRAFYDCRKLSSLTIPVSVTNILYEATLGCDSLTDVYYGGTTTQWDSVTIGRDNTGINQATIHCSDGNWEPEPVIEPHDTLESLTTVDYMLFSVLAYRDLSKALGDPTASPVVEPKTIKEFYSDKWNKTIPDSDGDLGHLDATYAQVFGGISNWYPTSIRTESNGFGATIFGNGSGDFVIAYCGSLPPNKWFDNIKNLGNALADWLFNDLTTQILDIAGPQIGTAIELYDSVSSVAGKNHVAVTGHSLGGGLADIVSAYSDCAGVTFNAISSIDVAYATYPKVMGREFEGVNRWAFVDHTNQYDVLAGMYEETTLGILEDDYQPLKPYISHKSRNKSDAVGANHGMGSFLTKKAGNIVLTDETYEFMRINPHSQKVNGMILNLGTNKDDRLTKGISDSKSVRAYGGDGRDYIATSSKADFLVGGLGNDTLDGNRGNDQYVYYKGHGEDTIYDIAGQDILYLYGFDSDDEISLFEASDTDAITIRCNGEDIVNISTHNRELSLLYSFKVIISSAKDTELFDITEYFKTKKYGQRLLVSCPVDVEILDGNDNVVYILKDGEEGNYYTDYGNFYVFEEENGEFGKVLDLAEGYTSRIVGVGSGTMDVTYQIPIEGELTDPIVVTDVNVTDSLLATIVTNKEGDVVLQVDTDGDGTINKEYSFENPEDIEEPNEPEKPDEPEDIVNPFTDVKESDYFYEPVMWAVQKGITSGVSKTRFAPNDACTRAQVVTFLWRAAGEPEPTITKNPFKDVKSSDYFYKAVLWAVEKGITAGTSKTAFSPNSPCTRGQVVTFLWRSTGMPEPKSASNPFSDVKSSDYYYKAVLWAVENEVTAGVGNGRFAPNQACTRGQIVTFLFRAFV